MGTFPEHRTIQMEACRAVEALADGNEENVRLLGEAVRYLPCHESGEVDCEDELPYISIKGFR